MIDTTTPAVRAYLVGLDLPRAGFDGEDSLDELASLVEAAGGTVVGRILQPRRAPDPNSWVGKGKAAEIAREVARLRPELEPESREEPFRLLRELDVDAPVVGHGRNV